VFRRETRLIGLCLGQRSDELIKAIIQLAATPIVPVGPNVRLNHLDGLVNFLETEIEPILGSTHGLGHGSPCVEPRLCVTQDYARTRILRVSLSYRFELVSDIGQTKRGQALEYSRRLPDIRKNCRSA
jgi:hypothetical protein